MRLRRSTCVWNPMSIARRHREKKNAKRKRRRAVASLRNSFDRIDAMKIIITLLVGLTTFMSCMKQIPDQPWSERADETPIVDTGERLTLIEGLKQQITYSEKAGNDSLNLDGY